MRPDWPRIYAGAAHVANRDGELVQVTRETLRLAASALRAANEAEAYHNLMAAEREALRVLGEPQAAAGMKPYRLTEQRYRIEGSGAGGWEVRERTWWGWRFIGARNYLDQALKLLPFWRSE